MMHVALGEEYQLLGPLQSAPQEIGVSIKSFRDLPAFEIMLGLLLVLLNESPSPAVGVKSSTMQSYD